MVEGRISSRSPFLRKPIPRPIELDDGERLLATRQGPTSYEEVGESSHHNLHKEYGHRSMERHLTLLDLVAIGVGGTVGSGLFVLAGLVSHQYAGPSAILSWAISGGVALLSGSCYAELSGRIPLLGGCYAFCFVALGEWPAFLAATCLSLDYIAASAAVSRSWGDKCGLWLIQESGQGGNHWWNEYGTVSPLAFCISSATVTLLLMGIKESKKATNFFTITKVCLVIFMIVTGSMYVKPSNWSPFVPKAFGVAGMFRGATGTFFGYVATYHTASSLHSLAMFASYCSCSATWAMIKFVD